MTFQPWTFQTHGSKNHGWKVWGWKVHGWKVWGWKVQGWNLGLKSPGLRCPSTLISQKNLPTPLKKYINTPWKESCNTLQINSLDKTDCLQLSKKMWQIHIVPVWVLRRVLASIRMILIKKRAKGDFFSHSSEEAQVVYIYPNSWLLDHGVYLKLRRK